MTEPGEVTLLLQQAEKGDPVAADQLYRMVKEELRAIAVACKQRADQQDNVSTTHLIDDAFLQVVGKNNAHWQPGDRRRFYSWISRKMQDLLIDTARKVKAQKRGGKHRQVELQEDVNVDNPAKTQEDFLIDLHEALERFQTIASEETIVFRIRTFLHCTFGEIAERLEISETKAKNCFQRAQFWLKRELKDYRYDA